MLEGARPASWRARKESAVTISLPAYFQTLYEALKTISESAVERAVSILHQAYLEDRTIFVIGNGQSATTASAFALDLAKQTRVQPPRHRFRIIALTDNTAALTAWANDVDYKSVFVEQLKTLFRPGDTLLALSASGNSPNILAACAWVRDHGGKVVGLAGFEGGQLRTLADECLVVGIEDYGHIETAHLALLHYWVDLFRELLAP